MTNRFLALAALAAFAALLATPVPALALGPQKRAATRAPSAAAAVRTVKGNLRGSVIAVRTVADRPAFDFVLAKAAIVNGKLELHGDALPPGRTTPKRGTLKATLVGTLAKEPTPEYLAARAKRNAARSGAARPSSGQATPQTPGGPATTSETASDLGQLSQSTQSTARTTPEPAGTDGERPKTAKEPIKAAATGITGCEVMYLRLELPPAYVAAAGGKSVQLNVALAQIDNQHGVHVNQRICRVVRALEGGDETAEAELAELNRLVSGGK
jgi:hypothetical protein